MGRRRCAAFNGANPRPAAHPLRDKDVIELAGVKMEFVNSAANLAA
jgi:hypothetical protein